MRRANLVQLALAIGLVLATPVALAAGEPSPGEDDYCGDEYWFHASGPAGWARESAPSGEALQLAFHPADQPARGGGLGITVLLPLAGTLAAQAGSVDVEEALRRWIGLLNAFAGAETIRPSALRHPTLPTAAAELIGKGWTIHAAAVDAKSGRGHVFLAALTKKGEAPSQAELAAFRGTLASLSFDPERVCVPGPDGAVTVARAQRGAPGPEAPPASRAEPRGDGFDSNAAAGGCSMLQKLFVPVTCDSVDLDGAPAFLVSFEDGDQPAAVYSERYTTRVAAAYCYEADRGAGAYPLVFEVGEGRRVRGAVRTVRTYSCAERRLGEPRRVTQVERLRAASDPQR